MRGILRRIWVFAHNRKAPIFGRFVGASIARLWGLPGRLYCRDGCNGRHICRPYKPTRKSIIAVKSRAGHAPPLRGGEVLICNSRKFPPHQSPAVTASPRGGSLSVPRASEAAAPFFGTFFGRPKKVHIHAAPFTCTTSFSAAALQF